MIWEVIYVHLRIPVVIDINIYILQNNLYASKIGVIKKTFPIDRGRFF